MRIAKYEHSPSLNLALFRPKNISNPRFLNLNDKSQRLLHGRQELFFALPNFKEGAVWVGTLLPAI